MTARHRVRTLDRPHGPRKATPHYELPPMKLTESERVAMAIALWRCRSDLLMLAPLVPAWSSRLLCHAKSCVQLVDHLTPEPPHDG
jgi:hypothetical protein